MATGRVQKFALWLLPALAAATGCAQPGPFTSRQTTLGSLKASVSQLEFENEKLKKEVGELKADNSRLDTQLAQEIDANGEVTARLDDAKDLIRRQGGNTQAVAAPSRNYEDDEIPPPVPSPRSRTTKAGRKAPAASIPAQPTDPTPFGTSNDGLGYQTSPRPSRDLGTDDGNQDDRWLPVARGLATQVR